MATAQIVPGSLLHSSFPHTSKCKSSIGTEESDLGGRNCTVSNFPFCCEDGGIIHQSDGGRSNI